MSTQVCRSCWRLRHGLVAKSPAIASISPSTPSAQLYNGRKCLHRFLMRGYADDSGRKKHKPKNYRGVSLDNMGSWNTKLNLPILYDQSVKKGKIIPRVPLDEIQVTSVIGRRKVNEDRCVVEELGKDLLYLGIFDGHGGAFAADFVTSHLIEPIKYWLTQTSDLQKVLQHAFCDTHNLLARHISFYHLDKETAKTGTTATVCLLRDSTELVVGHVGDSLAILCRDGRALRLSVDHDPEDSDESGRIVKKGGKIIYNSQGVAHVNGRLAMTRSFGDMELKSFGVTATPYIKSVEVKHSHDAFLVLGSDGLSFAISDAEIVDVVNRSHTPEEACHRLTDQAQHFGSEDNVTVMVVPLGAWGKYQAQPSGLSFGRMLSHAKNY